jgi:hypothetical protein
MLVALLALFVALGGTVYAGSKISGKQIKKNSLPGNRIKKHTITGQQVNLNKLGAVPNAKKLGGQEPSAYFPSARVFAPGLIRAGLGQTVTIGVSGPFTLSLQCINAGGGETEGQLIATSTEIGSHLDSTEPKTSEILASEKSAAAAMDTGVAQSLIAPSGASLQGTSDVGVNTLGASCVAEFTGISS